jgi:hypothetical protein
MKPLDNIGYKTLEGIAIIGTLCAPVTTGYVIARNLISVKQFMPQAALTAAIAVELTGFAAANVALAHWGKDTKQSKTHGSLYTWIGVIAFLAYIGVAMGLTWLIEGDIVLATFPLMSLVASVVLALTLELKRREITETQEIQQATLTRAERLRLDADHQRRVEEMMHKERLARIEANKEVRIAKSQNVTSDVTGDMGNVTLHATSDERRATLRDMVTRGDTPNVTQLSKQFGVSRAAIYKDLEHVTTNGNGHN